MIEELTFDSISDPERDLLVSAETIRDKAYAPYSGFQVGVALLTSDGTVFNGVNVENAAYGSTICADRIALGNAITAGYQDFKTMAIAINSVKGPVTNPAMPCGSCRQFMYEFWKPDYQIEVISMNTDRSTVYRASLKDLLPGAFGSSFDE